MKPPKISQELFIAALHAFFGNGPRYTEWLAEQRATPDRISGGEEEEVGSSEPDVQRVLTPMGPYERAGLWGQAATEKVNV